MPSLRVALLCLAAVASCAGEIAVVVPRSAPDLEKLAAAELALYLGRMYPAERFSVGCPTSGSGLSISFTRSAGRAESFSITTAANRVTIASPDSRGALYAVYSLLEKLGCGFYLSYETLPPPRTGRPDFREWTMSDAPLVHDRIVFDWH